ncbi:hypothetical protein AXX17_AT2G23390 [Arabidopsis thaliana]|uniref:Uncharacterized protein n=1 Tax=Arabidopsis thaliana TaxID=3702 RepID=A0A178VT63_ARATH|nr:hypothetical protein AXX17_AT2G23390 [Arabidopsis thaliana]
MLGSISLSICHQPCRSFVPSPPVALSVFGIHWNTEIYFQEEKHCFVVIFLYKRMSYSS